MDILLITIGLIMLLSLYAVNWLHNNIEPSIKEDIGLLTGSTCKEQTREILQAVLEKEVLFELVKEIGAKFSGLEHIDIENINTSKFAKLVAKYNVLPTQVTSAERYFRTFKNEYYTLNKQA
jgi:hypothetical protein